MTIKLMAVGDLLLQSKQYGQNPFVFIESVLHKADFVFGNLEAPITQITKPAVEKASPLRAPPDNISHLSLANFSIVTLANNHICDYGPEGATDTITALKTAGIKYAGAGRDYRECFEEAVLRAGDTTIAFIGFYDEGASISSDKICIAGLDPQLVKFRIADLHDKYDFVVVSFHWGIENVFYPSPEQQAVARGCIDAGAAMILGHHPHRFQGVERYKNGLIFYSLGNFNFMACGSGISPFADISAIADIDIGETGALSFELIPIEIDENYCPRPITEKERIKTARLHFQEISMVLTNGIKKWWWYGEIARPYLLGNLRAFKFRIRKYGFVHFLKMLKWLASRSVLKCYIGLLRRWLDFRG